jgi:hypothetical protein
MKNLLTIITLGITLITVGCYSNTAKEADDGSTEQTAPKPTRSGRY